MSSKQRLPLALVTLFVLFGITIWVYRSERGHDETSSAAPLAKLPTIKADEIVELEIQRPNEPVIKLSKASGAWKLTEPVQADVDESAVKAAVDVLADLKVRSIAATKKENHSKLEVDDAHAVRVIAKRKDAVAIDMLIGANRSGGTMVRLQGQDQVLALQGAIKWTFNKPPRDWRDRVIVDISSDKITSLTFTKPSETFSFVKTDGEWKLGPKQKKIENFDPAKVSSLASTLSDIRASDFAPPDTYAEGAGLTDKHATVIRIGLSDDAGAKEIVLRLGVARGNEGSYLVREGKAVTYLVSKYLADMLNVDATKFQPSKEGAAPGAGAAPGLPNMPNMPGMMPGMPQGMPSGMGGGE